MKAVHPYLLFNGNTAEVFEFYSEVFGREIAAVVHYGDFGPEASGPNGEYADLIANITLQLTDSVMLMASDVPPDMNRNLHIGGNVQLTLVPDDAAEAHRLFDALAADGTTVQPLHEEPFAELYGEVTDRFGTSWIIIIERPMT